MTTNKHMLDVADEMASVLKKLTDGLENEGVDIDGFNEAISVQDKWVRIKLRRTMELFINRKKGGDSGGFNNRVLDLNGES